MITVKETKINCSSFTIAYSPLERYEILEFRVFDYILTVCATSPAVIFQFIIVFFIINYNEMTLIVLPITKGGYNIISLRLKEVECDIIIFF